MQLIAYFIFFLPTIIAIGLGTIVGFMHETGFLWHIAIRIILILTIVTIVMFITKSLSSKLTSKLKGVDLTKIWYSLVCYSLLAVFLSATTAALSNTVVHIWELYDNPLFMSMFAFLLMVWILWIIIAICLLRIFWTAFPGIEIDEFNEGYNWFISSTS